MSYDPLEKANTGITIDFYQFQRGNLLYRYTNADQDVTMNGVGWSAVPFDRDTATYSGNATTDSLQLTAPSLLEAVQQFRGQAPSDTVYLTMFQCHALALAPLVVFDGEAAAVWVGTVSDVQQSETDKIIIKGATLASAFDREGLRLTYGRNCPYVIYDRNCRVDPNAFKVSVNLEGVTGDTITASALAAHGDGYYDEGWVEWQIADGVFQRLAIQRQLGNTATLLGTTDNLNIGSPVNFFPGCAQTKDACVNKFNNILNFGGFDMPGDSPFNGNPIF